MNRVISAQSTSFGQLASAAGEGIITFDEVDLLEQGVELGHGVAQLPRCDAAQSLGLGESGACLRSPRIECHRSHL